MLKTKSSQVMPHGVLVPEPKGSHQQTLSTSKRRLRVAFIGAPVYHKGWNAYKALAETFADDDRYMFIHLGVPPNFAVPSIASIKVMTSREQRSAMINAIRALNVDVALVLSVWPETFCFTAHEAIAGGALLIAAQTAGHAAVLAGDPSLSAGIVVADDQELKDLFAGSTLQRRVRGNEKTYAFMNLCGTIDWITSHAQ